MTDDQIEGFIDYLSSFDAATLKWIAGMLKWLSSFYKPVVDLYKSVDSATYGSAKYLVMAAVAAITYLVGLLIWWGTTGFIRTVTWFIYVGGPAMGLWSPVTKAATTAAAGVGAGVAVNVAQTVATPLSSQPVESSSAAAADLRIPRPTSLKESTESDLEF